ncbi:MAG TPA: Npt1/Npt2 family nucleotide transporter [Terriglobales bacterium]|nr:Npt1/Npt2 family nucleotide transporter [Terriglobales bacterium]
MRSRTLLGTSSLTRAIEHGLNLRPGELARGVPLFAYLFLIMAAYVTGRVVRDSLFLSRFPAVRLPYVDIATAFAVGVVVAAYIRVARGRSLRSLLLGSLVLCTSNCLLFWGLARYSPPRWLYPTIYVWVGIFGVLATTQVWALANHVLTTREARRVFGLVASGAITGGIFAGFFCKLAAKAFGTESLLLGMAAFLAICPLLVVIVWKQHQAVADTDSADGNAAGPQDLLNSMRLVLSSPYLRAIASVIWISSFVTALISWQFKAIAKDFIPAKDHLAAFFGDFTFYAGILALAVQLLLTSRLLRRFGIGLALFTLPVALLAASAYLLVASSLFAAVLLRGSDWVWRYSIDKSAVELLYLPLPARLKFQVKWFIDTVIWRMGDGIAGLTILFFAAYLGLTARQMSWVGVCLVGGWLTAVWVARRQYVATLSESMKEQRVEVDRSVAPILDRSTTEVLAANLTASDPKEILYALKVFESSQKQAAHPAIRDLLSHPAADVRKKAISILAAAGDKAVLPQMERLLQDDNLEVRTEALLYLAHFAHVDPLERIQQLGDFADFSIRSAMTAFLARPGEAQNLEAARQLLATMVAESGPEGARTRAEAARLMGILSDDFGPMLSQLLADSDEDVVREAIRSVGKLRKRRLVPEVLDRLSDARFVSDVTEALARFGDSIVGHLRDQMSDPDVPIIVRREIPSLLGSMGTQSASHALMEHLLDTDTGFRMHVLSALTSLHRKHPEFKCDAELLETALAAEILGHYRSYQIVERLGTMTGNESPVAETLSESMKQEIKRIFRLLELLYPHHDFGSAYIGLQSKSLTVHDNALEFLDTVLKSQLRELLVPLLDGKVSAAERAGIANRVVPVRIDSSEQAAAALVASDDPWLRSCGAYAIGTLGLTTLIHELKRCATDADPLVRETARQATLRLQNLRVAST